MKVSEQSEQAQQAGRRQSGPRASGRDRTPTEESDRAQEVAEAVGGTEIVEPVRMGRTDEEAPPATIVFKNDQGFDVVLSAPDRMKIPAGKGARFPSGYHRAIHRQSPHLACEVGRNCEVARSVRGE